MIATSRTSADSVLQSSDGAAVTLSMRRCQFLSDYSGACYQSVGRSDLGFPVVRIEWPMPCARAVQMVPLPIADELIAAGICVEV